MIDALSVFIRVHQAHLMIVTIESYSVLILFYLFGIITDFGSLA